MRTKINPELKDRIKVLELKVETLKKNYDTLYNWAYSHRIRRTEQDKEMLRRAKAWTDKFESALKKGEQISYIRRMSKGNGKLKIVFKNMY